MYAFRLGLLYGRLAVDGRQWFQRLASAFETMLDVATRRRPLEAGACTSLGIEGGR